LASQTHCSQIRWFQAPTRDGPQLIRR
jgi:hypothetical protein